MDSSIVFFVVVFIHCFKADSSALITEIRLHCFSVDSSTVAYKAWPYGFYQFMFRFILA